MFDIPKAIEAVATLGDSVVKRIWPDATEIEKTKLASVLQEMQNAYTLQLSQIDVNKTEAESGNPFDSGWRPFIGWVCGASLAYAAILEPVARFIAVVVFSYTGIFPVIDTTLTMQILIGLLGLGGYRTYEKLNGVAKK